MKKNKKIKKRKTFAFIGLGILFWALAAGFIRFLGNHIFADNFYTIIFFISTILIVHAFIKISRILTNSFGKNFIVPITIICAVATILDGLFIIFYREIYSDDPFVIIYGSAWLLWSVGLCQTITIIPILRQEIV